MISSGSSSKLEYLRAKRSGFEQQIGVVQAEIEAVADVTIKGQYEKRLNLLFKQIEQVDQEIQSLQQNLRDQLIKDEIDHLIEILKSSESQWEVLQQSYRTTLLHWPSLVQRNVENVQSIVSELNKIAQVDFPYTALEEFIAHLIINTSDPVLVNALNQWGTQYRAGIDWLQFYNQIQSTQNKRLEKAQPAILMTILRCDEASTQAQEDETYYQLDAWLVEDMETYQTKKTGYHRLLATDSPDAVPRSLEDLLRKITHLLNHFLTEQRHLCESCENYPQLHIFLPLELMHLGVDVWQLNLETGRRPEYLGHDHVVVIRCANRYDGTYKKRPSWLKLWKRHQSLLKEFAKGIFVPVHDSDLDALIDTLDAAVNLEEESKIVGLHVTQAPVDIEELCYEMLDFGLPIAIWPRSNLANLAHETQLCNLLAACRLEHLPQTVKDKRYEARRRQNSPDCHIGHHLSLLWDDPNLIPPKSA